MRRRGATSVAFPSLRKWRCFYRASFFYPFLSARTTLSQQLAITPIPLHGVRLCFRVNLPQQRNFSSSTCCNIPQASNVALDLAAYSALLSACAMSSDVLPPHDLVLSTLETMQVLLGVFIADDDTTPIFYHITHIFYCDTTHKLFCGCRQKESPQTPTRTAQSCACAAALPCTFKPCATSAALVPFLIMLLEFMPGWSSPACISAAEPL